MQMRLKKNWGWMPIEYTYIFTGLKITQFILQLCTVNVKISYKKCSGFHFAHLKVLNSGANKIIFPYHFLLTIYRFFLFPYPPIHILFHNLRCVICGRTVQPAQKRPRSQSFRKEKIFLKKSRRPGGRNHAVCQEQNLLVRSEFFHKIGSILL